jgi:hypothetical protein
LTTLYLTDAKNTDSWRARNGDLQHPFPLDISMVPSSAPTVASNSERLSCDGFSLGETIRFGSLELITNRFSGLSLSPLGTVQVPSSRAPPPQWPMAGDSAEGFPMAPNGEGRTDIPSPRRYGVKAPPTSTTTILQPENPPIDQATMTIPPR